MCASVFPSLLSCDEMYLCSICRTISLVDRQFIPWWLLALECMLRRMFLRLVPLLLAICNQRVLCRSANKELSQKHHTYVCTCVHQFTQKCVLLHMCVHTYKQCMYVQTLADMPVCLGACMRVVHRVHCVLHPLPQILFRLRRQTSVPNLRCSSHHPLLPSATTAGPDNHSSQSLARTSSAMSIGGVESAQSGYLASDGSSLTLDGEQDFAPSCGALRNGEWNVHVGSLLSPTSPLGNEIFDSMFEQHIRQYSNTSSASSANQSTGHRTVSPPLRTRELGMDRLYRAVPRRSSGTAKKLLSPPDYHPRWSTTSNEGVDV